MLQFDELDWREHQTAMLPFDPFTELPEPLRKSKGDGFAINHIR
jgi:hypothetical protein